MMRAWEPPASSASIASLGHGGARRSAGHHEQTWEQQTHQSSLLWSVGENFKSDEVE
jgi:hypothetical protein